MLHITNQQGFKMVLSKYEIQLANELALINYGTVFSKLTQKQKAKIVDEFLRVKSLGNIDKIEQYLSYKSYGKLM